MDILWEILSQHPRLLLFWSIRSFDFAVPSLVLAICLRWRSVVRYSQKQVSPLTWPGDDAGTQGAVCKSHVCLDVLVSSLGGRRLELLLFLEESKGRSTWVTLITPTWVTLFSHPNANASQGHMPSLRRKAQPCPWLNVVEFFKVEVNKAE